MGTIDSVQISDKTLNTPVLRIIEDIEGERLEFLPFVEFRHLIAHKVKLLARMSIHIGIEIPNIGEFVVVASPHLVEDAPLHMNNFVMTKRKNEVLTVEVGHREGDLIVAIFLIDRVLGIILEGIIHPAKIPLVVKAESLFKHPLCDMSVGRRIFSNGHNSRKKSMKISVSALNKFNSTGVFSALAIAFPVDDIAYSIHSESIYMVQLPKINERRNQE
jgi:hypothetical protein